MSSVNVPENIISEHPKSNLGLKKKFDLKASKVKDENPDSSVTTIHEPQFKEGEVRPHAVTHTLKKDEETVESLSVLNPKQDDSK